MKKIIAVFLTAFTFFNGIKTFNNNINNKDDVNLSDTYICEMLKTDKYDLLKDDKYNIDVHAKSAMLMDYNSGTVVFSKNETLELPIASMCKIMTLLLCFEKMDEGLFTLEDEIIVSETASGMGGSQVFLDANKPYIIGELIKSIVVASANDASVAMAEHISGSEEAFTSLMNEKAESLGMSNTVFANCTGLPKCGQHCCAKDVAIMFKELLHHDDYFRYSKIWMDKIEHEGGRFTEISNTNKLVRFYEGCDSGKTGYTSEAKHCLTASAYRNGMRLISVVIGEPDSKTRFADSSKMFNFGFANFENKIVVDKSKPLDIPVKIEKGKKEEVSVIPETSFYIFNVRNNKVSLDIDFVPDENIKAPVKQGDTVGKITIYKDGVMIGEVKVCANEDIGKMTYFDVIKNIIHNWAI